FACAREAPTSLAARGGAGSPQRTVSSLALAPNRTSDGSGRVPRNAKAEELIRFATAEMRDAPQLKQLPLSPRHRDIGPAARGIGACAGPGCRVRDVQQERRRF